MRAKQNTTSRFNIYINKRISWSELILLSLYLNTVKHMKIQGKELYVFMQCTCIDINMGELSESGKSMQFLKVIEHANARLTIQEATEPPNFGR